MGPRHLLWIPAAGAVSFGAAYVFGDRLALPVDLYYAIYFVAVIGCLAVYASRTGLNLRAWATRRLGWGLVLGLGVGALMVRNVLSRPPTELLTGGALAWAVVWRGFVYGAVDGLLLFAFPWVVVWRAFGAESATWRRKVPAAAVAWVLILGVTTLYHLGYADFRSRQLLQPNVGSAITATATLVSANPVASPVAHVMLHVAAVVHAPQTELFLPPHRGPGVGIDVRPSSGLVRTEGEVAP